LYYILKYITTIYDFHLIESYFFFAFQFFYNKECDDAYFTANSLKYSSQDFDNIKKIIFEMNDIDDAELFFDKEISDALKKAQDFKSKHGEKMADFEEQISIYSIYTGLTRNEIKNLTIRQYNKDIMYIPKLENWRVYKAGEASGMFKFEKEIEHFMSPLPKNGKLTGLVDEDVQGFTNKAQNMFT
jgi:hypothetical protein